MGKPNPQTANTSCSGYIPRYIVHRVAMSNPRSKDNPDAIVPKMAKQNFAFSASLRTRILTWKIKPREIYEERNKNRCTTKDNEGNLLCCDTFGKVGFCTCPPGKSCRCFTGGCICVNDPNAGIACPN